jgi:hypothetical protein
MAVEKLDLKSIWEAGQPYEAWLAASEENKRAEMERIYKQVPLSSDDAAFLKAVSRPVHILCLAEDWCGDVRRNVPVMARLCAENSTLLRARYVDKESRPDLMVRYLTNGAEAIPIIVFLNENFVEVGHWGPRPEACKKFMARGKAAGKIDAAREKIHEFYNRDAHVSTVAELRQLIATACAVDV